MQFTAPVDVPVVAAANRPLAAGPNRISLPSMLPPDCETDERLVGAERREQRVAVLFGEHRQGAEEHQDGGHHRHQHPSLVPVAHEPAERHDERERDQQERPDLQDVGEAVRVRRTGAPSWRCRSRRRSCRAP